MASADHQHRIGSPSGLGTRITLHVRFWLLALALVPLIGAGWFAYNEIEEVSA